MSKTYRCVRPCWHKKRLYKIGDTLAVDNVSELPMDKDGKLRHFVPVGEFSADLVEKVAIADELAKKKAPLKLKPQKADA